MTPTGTPEAVPALVIGGGVGGLVTALGVARAGHRPVVVEAGVTCGGVLSAHRVGGLILDAGAESFATARPSVANLLTELGLADRMTVPNPAGAWVRHRGGSAPLPAMALLGIPGRPWAGDVRRVIGTAGAARALLDAVLPGGSGLPPGSTLGAVVRSRMGARVLDRLVEPVAGGVYAADPDRLDVTTVAPMLDRSLRESGSLAGAVRLLRGGGERAGSAVATLTGGLHTLVPALVRAVQAAGGEVRTGTGVSGLEQTDAGWRVRLTGGTDITAGAVVLAVPAPTAAALLGTTSVAPFALPVLNAPISPVLICTLVVDDSRLDTAPRGTGVLISAHARGVQAKALTHATAKWPWLADSAGPGRHVLRLSYGRGGALPDEDALPAIALADAAELLGVPLTASALVDSAVVRWTSALPAPRPGHAEAVRALRSAARPLGLAVVGASVAGSGLAGVVADATLQASCLVADLDAVSGIAAASPPVAPESDRR